MPTVTPLPIAEIPLGAQGGLIGLTFAPGRPQPDGTTSRDLPADLDRIAAWQAQAIVTLVEAGEMADMGIENLGEEVRLRHMAWHHWPIRDYGVPDTGFEAEWPIRSARLRALVAGGSRVLIHCKGGLGRSGTIAARLLADSGVAPDQALAIVRSARPGAIETLAQEEWVKRR